jgi:hypothetical protein
MFHRATPVPSYEITKGIVVKRDRSTVSFHWGRTAGSKSARGNPLNPGSAVTDCVMLVHEG